MYIPAHDVHYLVRFSVGELLVDWILENNVIGHLFGPNLHVEVLKQSQAILSLVAFERRLTSAHLDCMWAAAQLKHCGRTVLELLKSLIKNLDPASVLHLSKLVSQLEPPAHNEQVRRTHLTRPAHLFRATKLTSRVRHAWLLHV